MPASWVGVGGGPGLISVEQVGSAIRAHFDEPMTSNALFQDPASYTITPTAGGDAVTVVTVSPGPGTYPTYVDLGLSNPTTSGSPYELDANPGLTDAAGNTMDPGGLTVTFLGFGADADALATLGIIEALTGVFGESLAELDGYRMTRLSAAASEGDVTVHVESTHDWPDEGEFALDGIVYSYTGRLAQQFTGIEHVAAGATVSGVATDHRIEAAVTDMNRVFSGLDLLRRAFLVAYAEGEDLNALGRNLGVPRPPLFVLDDQFRRVIQAVAYNPRGTVYGLELALEALVGAGNYEVFEDLVRHPNTVFIRVDPAAFAGDTEVGRAYLSSEAWDALYGSQDQVAIGTEPMGGLSVQLKDMDHLFSFQDDIPSDVELEPWPGETPINPWGYQGSEAEGSAVALTAGSHTSLTSTSGSTYYRMTDTDGARVTDHTRAIFSAVVRIPSTASIGASRDQCAVSVEDGARNVQWGILAGTGSTARIGLWGAAGWLGSTVDVALDEFHEIVILRETEWAELWVNGQWVDRVSLSSFDASAQHRAQFGCYSTVAGMISDWKHIGVHLDNSRADYWDAETSGGVASANPTRFVATTNFFVTDDAGKGIEITGSTATNPQGGSNNGRFLVDSLVGASPTDTVKLVGPEHSEQATVNSATPTRITVDDPEEFVYPDDLGKQIVISGSSLGNDGIYTITGLLEPGTLVDLATYDTPLTGVRTNICVASAAAFTSEQDLTYRVDPVFVTETLTANLSDAGEIGATSPYVATLRNGLWVNGLVMEIRYSEVLSAQVLRDADTQNVVGSGPSYTYYPFYLASPLGLVAAYIDNLTAAGVIPEYEGL